MLLLNLIADLIDLLFGEENSLNIFEDFLLEVFNYIVLQLWLDIRKMCIGEVVYPMVKIANLLKLMNNYDAADLDLGF